MIRKEVAMAKFKVLSWHLPERMGKSQKASVKTAGLWGKILTSDLNNVL
jgi:hypothetical protein